jgi:hypothetical protein
LADEDRASSASQDSAVTSSRYTSATSMGADHVVAKAAGQTSGPEFDHYTVQQDDQASRHRPLARPQGTSYRGVDQQAIQMSADCPCASQR